MKKPVKRPVTATITGCTFYGGPTVDNVELLKILAQAALANAEAISTIAGNFRNSAPMVYVGNAEDK